MSILNLPTLLLYYDFYIFFSSNYVKKSKEEKTSYFDVFARVSIGNVKKNLNSELDFIKSEADKPIVKKKVVLVNEPAA